MISLVSVDESFGYSSTGESRPRTRTVGWAPELRCRSDARRCTTSISRSAKSMSMGWPIGPRGLPGDSPVAGWTKVGASGRADDAGDLGDRGPALPDLLQPVVAKAGHPLLHGNHPDRLRWLPFERHRLDLRGHHHHLVQPDPALVAAAAAATAADRFVGLELHAGLVTALLEH